jgi:hypothetical protein
MSEAIPPLPNMPSWCGAQLKNIGTTLPLPSTLNTEHTYDNNITISVILVMIIMTEQQ